MADPTAISVILDPLALVFNTVRSLNWSLYLSWAFTVVAFPFKILIIPLSFFANILFVALSPAFYIVAYAYSGVKVVLGLIASLEPLYTFFGAAASVGILAGIVLALFSTIITSSLGMRDASPPRRGRFKGYIKEKDDTSSDEPDDDETHTSASTEPEWQWLDRSPSRRRHASGLLSQTILEEDDSG